jgi:FlaA1/EpsC-like NDP-sugar epimerase
MMFRGKTLLHWSVLAGFAHLCVITLSFWIAFQLRFDFEIPASERELLYRALPIALATKITVFYLMRSHLERWWRYLGFDDVVRLAGANAAASALFTLAVYAYIGSEFSRSVCCLDLMICLMLTAGSRFAVRMLSEAREGWSSRRTEKGLLVYGAGVAGITLAREIRANPKLGYQVVGFLDDDVRKHGSKLMGLPVYGSGEDATRVVESFLKRRPAINEIVVTMPSATGRQIRAAFAKGSASGVKCRIVPGLGELISGKLAVGKMREISVTDLLGREPVKLDLECVRRAVAGRSVLVTGAAGSIGTELCNQLASFEPRKLVALDQAESEVFRLEADLRAKFPSIQLVTEIADIRDPRRMDEVIEQHAVNSIFHAAAYKHVPLMEQQICEAVRNNVIGTWNLVQAAWRANVSNFLLISSDKAVNPTSIMGLTKRIAELIVSAQRYSVVPGQRTKFVCVRFGNVLVSNGSVVPTFKKQIAAGGPVTVTHPEIRRYFMTVEEAVQLVLQASSMASGSEIFVLDMGKPVRIADLARKMITLAGFVPDEDIEVRFVGMRPGEKLFEELSIEGENIVPTTHQKIRIFQGKQVAARDLVLWMAELQHLVWRREPEAVVAHLASLVPEYQPNMQPAAAEPQAAAPAPKVRAAAAGLVSVFKTAS